MPGSSAPPVLAKRRSALGKEHPERHSKGAVALENPHSRLPVLIKNGVLTFLFWAQKSGLRQSLHQIHNHVFIHLFIHHLPVFTEHQLGGRHYSRYGGSMNKINKLTFSWKKQNKKGLDGNTMLTSVLINPCDLGPQLHNLLSWRSGFIT